MNDLKLGSTVYWTDPFYRKEREGVIDGETRVSWILNAKSRNAVKIPKRHTSDTFHVRRDTGLGVTYYLTRECHENATWLGKNHYRLIRALEAVTDVAKLKLIADMIGYKEEEKP